VSSPFGAKIRAPLREPATILNPIGLAPERLEDGRILVQEPLGPGSRLDDEFPISQEPGEL
jgi:hypothetical protein